MSSAKGNRNFILKTLLCVFSLLFIVASPASAFWEQDYESHPDDLSTSLITGTNGQGIDYHINSEDHGLDAHLGVFGNNNYGYVNIALPFTGYLGFHVKQTPNSGLPVSGRYGLKLTYENGTAYFTNNNMGTIAQADYNWHWVEFKQNGNTISCYIDGTLKSTAAYTSVIGANTHISLGNAEIYFSEFFVDDITAKSCHTIIGMDNLVSMTDAGQYYKIGAPAAVTGKYYFIKVFDPDNEVVYEKTFDNNSILAENLIPIANLSSIGTYTVHLYLHNSDTSNIYQCMKKFTVGDAVESEVGTIELDKTEYESGDSAGFWVHLNEYTSGYHVVCEFPTSGMTLKKDIPVTSAAFASSFIIPDNTEILGSHTVYLIDPQGGVVASDDFDVYVPGLPDIAFDKEEYERSDKAYLYYKNAKEDSVLTLNCRYGGLTSQTLTYNVEGSGNIILDLGNLAASDSIYAVLKDGDGWTSDQDNAKIMVGNFALYGRVYNAKTGEAISGATVTVQGNSINTDISGNYNLTAISGFANYSVVKSGFNNITGTVAVFDMLTLHNFYMSPILENAGTGVHGTVVSSKTDYPLIGASVEIVNNDNGKRFSTIVNNVGYYEVNNNDLAGNLSVKAYVKNYDALTTTTLVNTGSLNNINFRLNAVSGFVEIDPSEHTGSSSNTDGGKTAAEKAYEEKYGSMGRHPIDFNGDGIVENSEWKYAGERFVMLIGLLAFMGFMMLINRRR